MKSDIKLPADSLQEFTFWRNNMQSLLVSGLGKHITVRDEAYDKFIKLVNSEYDESTWGTDDD